MATDLKTEITLEVKGTERETGIGVGGGASQLVHRLAAALAFANGTTNNTMDVIHSGSLSIASGVPATLDCRGVLTSVLTGDAVVFAEITWLILYNKSSTSGEYLTIGAGSNPVVALWAATGDAAICGPGGMYIQGSPIDGFATVAGTGDIITITAATGTIAVDYILIGRSA